MKTSSLILTLILLLAPPANGESKEALVELENLDTGELEIAGFELEHAQEVRIRARDLEARSHFGELTAAWILGAETRRPIWRMGDSEPVRRSHGYRDYDDVLRLEPGVYEVYYATHPDEWEMNEDEGWWKNAGRIVRRFIEREVIHREDYDEAVEDLRLQVFGDGRSLDDDDVEDIWEEKRDDALVALAPLGDDETEEIGFELAEGVEVEIYALGEIAQGKRFDYGWIVDTRTRRKVWSFDADHSERSGGSQRNRVARKSLRLPAGRYAAFFATDDSHSFEEWRSLPPYDPGFWGLSVWVKEPDKKEHAWKFEYHELPRERVIVDLTRMRDDEYEARGIALARPLDVRIYAVGEGFESGMADYGWIIDARTRRKVWYMDFARTTHAGGSDKNRQADEMVRLEAGKYIVVFVTDESHAYRDWNADPPRRPERWGITMVATGEDFDRDVVKIFRPREDEDESVLARIRRMTDDRHEQRDFELDQDARVAVYAVGEGTDGQMYDYGWIEDEDGEVIWEMKLGETEHAGGALKNRLFAGTLDLERGKYELHFRTDDSHSFSDWNEKPPHDPEAWGIRIALMDDE